MQARIDANPLRAFDSSDAGTQAVMKEAPTLLERLAPEDAEHFAEVRGLLDDAGIAYEVDPALVRGLDYYTRTVFEFTSDALGAQSGVGGGGRYDGLVEQLGGPPTPGDRLGGGRRADPARGRRARRASRRRPRSSSRCRRTSAGATAFRVLRRAAGRAVGRDGRAGPLDEGPDEAAPTASARAGP